MKNVNFLEIMHQGQAPSQMRKAQFIKGCSWIL